MNKWHWRTTQSSLLPYRAMVSMGRTEYPSGTVQKILPAVEHGLYRALGDPNMIGIEVWVEGDVVWSVMAWPDYDAMERFLTNQIDWMTELVHEVEPMMSLRHNAYRIVPTRDLPLAPEKVKNILYSVQEISPLGADAFPELSRQLGMKDLPI